MQIRRLLVEHLRNLEAVSLDELTTLNFFIGDNGAGKTSLLEAISIASQGRSFRHHKVNTVINQQQQQLSVFVECIDDGQNRHKIGIQRDKKNNYLVRIDGANASTLAQLSSILPVVVLDATSFELLDGSSSVRRKFIDWGVFHVEHGFYDKWKNLNRLLKQRNSLLRAGVQDYEQIAPWDKELISLSVAIEEDRRSYLLKFQQALNASNQALDEKLSNYKVSYRNGWGIEKLDFANIQEHIHEPLDADELARLLQSSFERDCRYHRTHVGPHRADMQIRVGLQSAKDIYSRGQKKTLVAAMKLAQADVVAFSTGKKAVLLLDDLPSELDDQHLARFIEYIQQQGYQSFITAVDDRIYTKNRHAKARMFHLERGRITPQNAQGEA